MFKSTVCWSIFFLLISISNCFSQGFETIHEFSADDRILILAPHPDDETLGTGGVIQKALKAGSKIKVVCYTNGDNNELAFIVYEKRLTFRKGEFLHMGEVRRKETLKAMEAFGLSSENVVFLGYPDFGTMEILTKYWGDTSPFKSMFSRVSRVAYPEAVSYNAPFVGESILSDFKKIIIEFKPTKIFVSHPADTNRDHQSLYLFLRIALWDLEGRIHAPKVYPYLIHVVGWPLPRGYNPELTLQPPDKLMNGDMKWQSLDLTSEQVQSKDDAIKAYKSQIEYDPPYLFTFARTNELFSDLEFIRLNKDAFTAQKWFDSKRKYDFASSENEKESKDIISDLYYSVEEDNLLIKINLKKAIDKQFGVLISLLGYSKKTDFAQMPKLNIKIGFLEVRVSNMKQPISAKSIAFKQEGRTITVKVPLKLLRGPEFVLAKARTVFRDLSLDDIAWRVIELK